MLPIVLALGVLAAMVLGIGWFLRANPSMLARNLRRTAFVVGSIVVAVMLIFSVRFLPEVLPELLGLAGLLGTALLTRYLRSRSSGGFSSPGSGQRTEVRTAFLRAWIDHGTGDVGGAVLAGRFAGRTLESLTDGELLELQAEASSDADSARVLEAYLDRRLGAGWRTARQPPPSAPRGDMTRQDALAVLGLAEGASADEIRAAHRRLIQRVHPDVGGSADLAARINRAKDVLLG
ncbi:MAG: molecular chaperone DnaJ [Alphaproteobacteria bacterium]|nr:molecular chaperone DnaJ [Alphaproteobacteria bacterium]